MPAPATLTFSVCSIAAPPRQAWGTSTHFTQPSAFATKRSYAAGACSSGNRWVMSPLPSRQHVGEQEHVVVAEVVRDPHRPHVGEGDAHVLRLAAVVAAGRVRVAVDAGGELAGGVRGLAVAEQPRRQ
jgi:hypothetical protein